MRARSWVLQILYLWESGGATEPLSEVAGRVFRSRRVAPQRTPRIERHLDALSTHLERVDHEIESTLDNWRMDRLSRIDRSILRLSVAEILFVEDVPPKVSIQEAIRLAGQYGGDASPRFVNGILDRIYRTDRGEP